MDLNKKNTQKILLIAGSIILFYWALQNLGPLSIWMSGLIGILSPIIVGLAMAFVINIPMSIIERNISRWQSKPIVAKIKRPISLVLAISFVIAIVLAVLLIVIPELGRTIGMIKEHIPGFQRQLEEWSNQLMTRFPEWNTYFNIELDWVKLGQQTLAMLQSGLTSFLGSTFAVVGAVFSGMVTFGLGFVLSIYILLQKEKLKGQFKRMLYAVVAEKKADRTMYVLRLTNTIFGNFFSGQCLEAVIIGFLFFVSMSILGFPYALMVSVIIGFTALIPVFGPFLGCLISVFFIVVTAPVKALWFLLLFIIIQQIEGNLIYPRVVGNAVGLPGMWVLLAVTIGGSLMGVIGMLIMVPLFSVIYTLSGEFVERRLKEKRVSIDKVT